MSSRLFMNLKCSDVDGANGAANRAVVSRVRNRAQRFDTALAACVSALLLLWTPVAVGQNVTSYDTIPEPFLFLLREPAVQQELKLTSALQRDLTQLNQSFDADLLASRLWSAEKGQRRLEEILAASRRFVQERFSADQRLRLEQISLRTRGIRFVLHPDVSPALELTTDQRTAIQSLLDATQSKLEQTRQAVADGKLSATDGERQYRQAQIDSQQRVFGKLTPDQQQSAAKRLGATFDLSSLGKVSFLAPELIDTHTWLNSPPLTLAKLRGKVVVVHFWTFGCHNCIQNYPWYKQWDQAYADDSVVLVGIHTPETETERQLDRVEQAVAKEQFQFPVLVDTEAKNWQAWGNSLWPSVYLVDKRGRVRFWWYGELNWRGAGGQETMTHRIDELLAEKP